MLPIILSARPLLMHAGHFVALVKVPTVVAAVRCAYYYVLGIPYAAGYAPFFLGIRMEHESIPPGFRFVT